MLLTTPQEHIINCLALMFMYPLSYLMENLKSKREQAMYESQELDFLSISNKFYDGCHELTFMDFTALVAIILNVLLPAEKEE